MSNGGGGGREGGKCEAIDVYLHFEHAVFVLESNSHYRL